MRDGNRKGAAFENGVCRILSVWLVPGEWGEAKVYELPFRRRFTDTTPLVGHWEGQGDILHSPNVTCPFCIECKKREKWDLDGMFGAPKWPPWEWWEQTKEQAGKTDGLHPLMVFTRNRRECYVLLEREVKECLQLKPKHGPVVQVERPSGERLVLALMGDLTDVPRARVLDLARRSRRKKSSTTFVRSA